MHGSFKRLILLISLTGFVSSTSFSFAWFDQDPIPERTTVQIQSYKAHEWWLLTWAEDELACKVFSEYDGLPALSDVQMSCETEVYQTWVEQPVCEAASEGGDVAGCEGYYLYYIGAHAAEREVVVELPPASVSVFLAGCQSAGSQSNCADIPALRLVGQEPLTDQRITQVNYRWRGTDRECEAALCDVPLSKTKTQGEIITFWADSSFGDSSEEFEALVRAQEGEYGWQVDVLSSQWTGVQPAALAQNWQSLPAAGEPPEWLGYPTVVELVTQQPFQYLAGRLIEHGVADASVCADRGLLFGGYASTCGLEQAGEELMEWQNQFDEKIVLVAQQNRISPQLLKNIIAQESQFWPGEYTISPHEYGLGRLTQEGADTLLMWNDEFYTDFCTQVLSGRTCVSDYTELESGYQAMLRGALIGRIDVTCAECQYGVDLGRIAFGIEVIADALLANGRQAGQMIANLTGDKAGVHSSYEDLWRFTLVNYNAGPGCLGEAMRAALAEALPLDWESVAANLKGDCRNAIDYVEKVTQNR